MLEPRFYAQGEGKLHGQTYRMWTHAAIQEENCYMNIGLLKHGFQVNVPLMSKEDVESVHLECGHCRRQTSGNILSCTTFDWGCLLQFPMNCPSRAVVRCASADLESFMVCAWCCCTMFSSWSSRILEHHGSGTMDRKEVDEQHGLYVPLIQSPMFLFLGTGKVCCLCYRSQCCPGLATTNVEWILDDAFDTRNFPACWAVSVLMCCTLHQSSRGHFESFL
jgi:hypothetical protein